VLVRVGLFLVQLAVGDQLFQQSGPFFAEDVGTGQAAITTADDQGIDAIDDHVLGSGQSPPPLTEGGTSGGSDKRSTFGKISSDVVPVCSFDEFSALD
jgi:hypothetical protein